VIARRALREWPLAVAGLSVLSVLVLAPPAAAQDTSPAEGTSVRFALTAANDGAAITEQTYRGKWLVVYFGYTFCPDVCPTTLLDIAQALDALGPRAGAVQGLFITVDPKRDTPEVLTEYVKSFDPRAYELSLVNDPKRLRSYSGAARAALAAGNGEKARDYFRRMVEMADAKSDRPELLRAREYLAAK
jgi:protein SCO1